MSKTGKLGRNPLERGQPVRASGLEEVLVPSALEKIKEMDIQIDWTEFCDTLVLNRLRKMTRLILPDLS